ncbi:hypothetical protein JAGODDHD_04228 [Sphingomonas paucimobilis]|nr:hypothetical protein [Sphingomonas paucimobilis]
MLPAQRGDVGEQLVGHVDAAAAQMTDSSVEIDGVPERHGRGDEGQAGGAMALVLEGAVAQFAEAVEEDGAGERVAGLALVENAAGATTLVGIIEPVEHEQGAFDPTYLPQRAGDRVLTREARQLAEHDRGAHRAGADRGGKAQGFVPVLLDRADLDRTGDERAQRRPRVERRQAVEPALVEVADAGREAEAEQMAQAEDMIDRAGGIGRMFADDQLAFMVEQAVEDMRGLAGIGGDDLGVERREAVGDVGVEQHAWFGAIAGVVIGAGLALTTGTKELPVRRRCIARSPDRRERMRGMAIDDRRQRRQIGFVAHMPFRRPAQARQRQPARAFGHAAQAEVGRIGEDRTHQRGLVGGGGAAARMDETVGESRPCGDLDQQIGDSDARQHRVEPGL